MSDLRIELNAPQGNVRAGERKTFTINLVNHGPDPAADVVITFTASLPLRIVSATRVALFAVQDVRVLSAHAAAVTCTSALPVRCELGKVAVGARETVTIVAVPLVTGVLRATAGVVSASRDPRPGSSVATVKTRIVRPTRPRQSPRFTG